MQLCVTVFTSLCAIRDGKVGTDSSSHRRQVLTRSVRILMRVSIRPLEPDTLILSSPPRPEARPATSGGTVEDLQHSGKRVLVVIPAFNEAATITHVVSEVRQHAPFADILVVDDGSTDGTAYLARRAGAVVAPLPFNLGVGGAMRTGYRYAARESYRAVVQVDGDGQHDASCISLLLARLADHDLVIGARFAGEGEYSVHGVRRTAMLILAAIMSRIMGTRLDDSTSGFRAAGPRAIRVYAHHYPVEYLGDTLETLVIAHKSDLAVCQVPVAMNQRMGGKPSRQGLSAARDLVRASSVVAFGLFRDWSVNAEALP